MPRTPKVRRETPVRAAYGRHGCLNCEADDLSLKLDFDPLPHRGIGRARIFEFDGKGMCSGFPGMGIVQALHEAGLYKWPASNQIEEPDPKILESH